MEKFKINGYFGIHEVTVNKAAYGNGNLAVQLMEEVREDGFVYEEPYATLTVNLVSEKLTDDKCAFIDTNNLPSGVEFVVNNALGLPTGKVAFSGFCMYPEVRFDMQRLEEVSA